MKRENAVATVKKHATVTIVPGAVRVYSALVREHRQRCWQATGVTTALTRANVTCRLSMLQQLLLQRRRRVLRVRLPQLVERLHAGVLRSLGGHASLRAHLPRAAGRAGRLQVVVELTARAVRARGVELTFYRFCCGGRCCDEEQAQSDGRYAMHTTAAWRCWLVVVVLLYVLSRSQVRQTSRGASVTSTVAEP